MLRIISARRASRRERKRYEEARKIPLLEARRRTAREVEAARKAIEAKLGTTRPRRGRPPKGAAKYTPVSIRFDPRILAWAKREARKRGLGCQTIINEVLLKASA